MDRETNRGVPCGLLHDRFLAARRGRRTATARRIIRNLDALESGPRCVYSTGRANVRARGSRRLSPAVLRWRPKGLTRPNLTEGVADWLGFLHQQRIDVLQVDVPDSTYFGVPVGCFSSSPRIVCTRKQIGY